MAREEIDPLRYYHLETFLFEDVRARFHRDGSIGAVDFFSIVIWKANRAKSRVAQRMLRKCSSLERGCRSLTRALYKAETPERRMQILLVDWQFRLPMATAILTVLWPDAFTIYDVRVCSQLKKFERLGQCSPNGIWTKYCDYVRAVDQAVAARMPLRDKDRVLWGRSALKQLRQDISRWEAGGPDGDTTPL